MKEKIYNKNNLLKVVGLLTLAYFVINNSIIYINPGYVGVFINKFSGKVNDLPVYTGYRLKVPFVHQIIEYPYYMQTIILTKDIREGSPTNEEIITNSIEGQQLSCDVSLSYTLAPDKVPHFYLSFRQPIMQVAHNFVKNTIRQAMQEVSGKIPVTDILGRKKVFLITEVENILKTRLNPYGFEINQFTLNQVRASDAVNLSIEQKNILAQEALKAQNELLKVKYEAQQRIETAKGKAKGILNLAQAESKANKVLAESIDNTLVKYKSIEKWDGHLPRIGINSNDTDPNLFSNQKSKP